MEDEIDISKYLKILAPRWNLILVIVVVSSLIIGWPSLSKKNSYAAKAALLLKGNTATLGSQNALTALLSVNITPREGGTFPVLIKSRAVAEYVLDGANLAKRIKGWDSPKVRKQDLVTKVLTMAKFSDNMGLFEIKVVTDDPVLSADIANAYARAGAEYWQKMNYTEARKKREYIESQLPLFERNLKSAEEALKRFSMIAPALSDLQGVDFGRLRREFEIQNSSYTMLRGEYENAKLEEAKEVEPFSMIDPAEPTSEPIKPKIFLNFVLGAVLGLFGGTLVAFGLEYWGNLKR
ncbi:MAG: GNVR domain-containing protein [Candidatus Margulisiibacteriota bacterium]